MPDHVSSASPVVDNGGSETAPDSGAVQHRSNSSRGNSGVQAGATQLRVRALQLLTRRDYCRAELKRKLAAHAESEEALDAVLATLHREGLLSDERYAAQRVAARGSRYGNARLQQELRQKGVGDEEIATALPEAGDETERCRAIWEKKFGRPPASPEERAKQMRFLQYRGFSGDAIRRVMRGADQ